jgi:hypothetical protein
LSASKKNVKKEEVKDTKPVNEHDYEHPDDEELEGKPAETEEELPKEELEKIAEAPNVLKDEQSIIPHFDETTEEFLKKINNLPVLTPETQAKISKHYADKKETWILQHIDDELYPIRFRIREKSTDKDSIKYKKETVVIKGKNVSKFASEELYFEGQSISPAHQHQVSLMEKGERILIQKMEAMQHKINNVLAVRNLISKILEQQQDAKKEDKIGQKRLMQLLDEFKQSVNEVPKDFVEQIQEIQDKMNDSVYKRAKFLAYAYLTIEDKYEDAFLADVKDSIEILQKRETLRVPT